MIHRRKSLRALLLCLLSAGALGMAQSLTTTFTVINVDVARAQVLMSLCENAVSALRSHGNTKLVLVNFILSIVETLHGEEYKAG